MTLKERLQNIGRAVKGQQTEKIVKVADKKEKGTYSGTVDLFKTDSGLTDYKSVSSKLLKANKGWVYKNNDVVAKEVGGIEFELYKTRRVGEEIEFIPILQHPLLDILDRFNEFTSRTSGFYLVESHQNLAGDAFLYVDGKGINIKGLYLLQPDKVKVNLGDPSFGQYIITSYEYEDNVDGKRVKETYDREDVIHFKQPNPDNPYRGKSKVEAVAEEIDTDNLITLANKRMYQQGLIANFVLATDKHLTDEQGKAIEAKLQASYGGANNAYKTLIMSGGLEPKSIQLTSREMETVAMLKWLRDKIMSAFGNTPASIGMIEDVNRASAESTLIEWKRTTVKSEMRTIADTLNEFLVPRFGDNLLLGFADPVPEDRKGKVDEAKSLVQAEIITQNEARVELGYEEVDEETADQLNREIPNFNPDDNNEEAVPKGVCNVSYKKHLRRSGILKEIERYKSLKKASKLFAEKIVKERKPKKTKENVARISQQFTNEQVMDFHNKQIGVVEAYEDIFKNKAEQYIKKLVEKAIAQIPNEVARIQKKALFDEEDEIALAVLTFQPILVETGILSAQHALKMAGDDSVYVPNKLRKRVRKNVEKFAKSMIKTDKDKIIDIIAKGVAEGKGIPVIRNEIRDTFEQYSKTQAERITRTEVIRASNQGTVDAWQQSEVVSGKEWLTAEDSRVDEDCEEMNGVIVNVESSFNGAIKDKFDEDVAEKLLDYGSVGEPPLHPDCRCTLIPVLVDTKAFDPTNLALENKVKDLENQIDKRTKEFKEIKAKNLELEKYAKELEVLAGEPEIITD